MSWRPVLAAPVLGALMACGGPAQPHSAAVDIGTPTPAQTSGPYVGGLADATPATWHHNWNMAQPVGSTASCGDFGRGGPPTLAENLASVRAGDSLYRAAAMVTVMAIRTPLWNSPDGHRWTQAEIDAGTAVNPMVYTPYVLRVERLLSSAGGVAVGQSVTGYVRGGRTSFGDVMSSCIGQPTVKDPQPGWTAVVIFGSEEDRPTSQGALAKPTITEFDIVKNGAAQTLRGAEPIP